MDCNVIRDLIPLCVDDCCSKESKKMVQQHIIQCPDCKAVYDCMCAPTETVSTPATPTALYRISDFKASVLQSVLLFVSFALITVGVAFEAATPSGFFNSVWALNLVLPATGFMLSLINWYFVKFYKTRKAFSNASWLITLGITACGYVWSIFHYEMTALFAFDGAWPELIPFLAYSFGVGLLLTAVSCVLSKVFSNRYAKLLGKE